ncbi:MAG: hypothetical protein BWY37_01742 [Firmicutes bacterium ADurb.Bin262]|nr:MAG: hypothetical protein BWY37_01742 [Firmicutes bacterium ADurb.Bin262]
MTRSPFFCRHKAGFDNPAAKVKANGWHFRFALKAEIVDFVISSQSAPLLERIEVVRRYAVCV